jgi:hypothetical protein
MKAHYWISLAVVAVVAYYVGMKYPSFWTKFTGS